jgi:hypothetical protein
LIIYTANVSEECIFGSHARNVTLRSRFSLCGTEFRLTIPITNGIALGNVKGSAVKERARGRIHVGRGVMDHTRLNPVNTAGRTAGRTDGVIQKEDPEHQPRI